MPKDPGDNGLQRSRGSGNVQVRLSHLFPQISKELKKVFQALVLAVGSQCFGDQVYFLVHGEGWVELQRFLPDGFSMCILVKQTQIITPGRIVYRLEQYGGSEKSWFIASINISMKRGNAKMRFLSKISTLLLGTLVRTETIKRRSVELISFRYFA